MRAPVKAGAHKPLMANRAGFGTSAEPNVQLKVQIGRAKSYLLSPKG